MLLFSLKSYVNSVSWRKHSIMGLVCIRESGVGGMVFLVFFLAFSLAFHHEKQGNQRGHG